MSGGETESSIKMKSKRCSLQRDSCASGTVHHLLKALKNTALYLPDKQLLNYRHQVLLMSSLFLDKNKQELDIKRHDSSIMRFQLY